MKKRLCIVVCACLLLTGCGSASTSDVETDDNMTISFSYGERTGRYVGDKDTNGLPDGFGNFTAKKTDGTTWTYSGQWEHGHLNEYGTTVWDSGLVHFGKNSDDSILGYGGYVYPDGRIILGELDDDGLDGTGLIIMPNGFTVSGNVVNGALQGWCTIYLTGDYEGYAFWGNFTDGNATGKVYAPDGSSAPATYKNSQLNFNETEFEASEAGEKADAEVPAHKGLLSEEQSQACNVLLQSCQYSDLHEYISELTVDGYLQKDESSSELLGWLEQLEDIRKKCEVITDSFTGKTSIYYSGVRDISDQINVVPIVQITDYGASMEYELGFRKSGWLFFDTISVTSHNKKTEAKSFNSFDINRDAISGNIVQESVFSVFPSVEKFIDDENVMIRFENTDKRENIDHQLTDVEVSAISTLAELRNLHGSVSGRLWAYGKEK